MLRKRATAAVTMEMIKWDQKTIVSVEKLLGALVHLCLCLPLVYSEVKKGEYSHSCSSDQNPAGGEDRRGPVHQPLQLLRLHHQPRVWLQRCHLLVFLLRRLHQQELSGASRQIWIQHHSGQCHPCDGHLPLLLNGNFPVVQSFLWVLFSLNPPPSSAAHTLGLTTATFASVV